MLEVFFLKIILKNWVKALDTDILLLSDTWANKSITDEDIAAKRYNLFRCECPK